MIENAIHVHEIWTEVDLVRSQDALLILCISDQNFPEQKVNVIKPL